ncbi:hydroxylysine kinase isoform X2 [Empidonax traillii]|uniref:hydroxylysine kinase isoform X2 n=1 Tax=Empidonax traillii TaxID=164674 RepID=UPI000FFDA2D7|nr:hydroxylysine kinase isoform X2 [Empidonax traillii]
MSSGNDCRPQTFSKPALSEKEAAELVDRVFGLKVSWLRPLPSYDDQNFHVRVSGNSDGAGGADEFVLKITNSEDSREPDLIQAQTQAMMFLSAQGFPSATPHLTRDGSIMSLESGGAGNKKHMVRLLTYLPGTPVAKIATNAQILYEIGKLAASLDKTLAECQLCQRTEICGTSHLHCYHSVLMHSINHGDLNDHNILVDSSCASLENPQYRVSGILDFSDMSYGYYVFEVAIAIMYMMIESPEPLGVGGHVLAGFESVVPLTAEERGALFLLVSGRFAQSLVIAAHTALLYPENRDYLMITAKTGWKHLMTMFEMGQEAVEKKWFETARAYAQHTPAPSVGGC